MTQKIHNMTALHFRDSPCDLLPRPRALRAGADKTLRRPPLFTPRRLPDGWALVGRTGQRRPDRYHRQDRQGLRFAYAGFPTNRIHVVKDYKALCEQSTSHKLPVYMMPTYTAMLALRQTISKQYGYKNFWE